MSTRLATCQVTHQIQTGCICPVQIIEEEDEHMMEANSMQEGSNRFIEAKACLLRRQLMRESEISEADAQLREDACEDWRGSNLLAELIQRGILNVWTKCF